MLWISGGQNLHMGRFRKMGLVFAVRRKDVGFCISAPCGHGLGSMTCDSISRCKALDKLHDSLNVPIELNPTTTLTGTLSLVRNQGSIILRDVSRE